MHEAAWLGDANREEALVELLMTLFDADQLTRWARLNLGSLVHNDLPSNGQSLANIAFQTVLSIGRHGLATPGTFASLVDARPNRANDIWTVARLWGVSRPGKSLQGAASTESLREESGQVLALRPRYQDEETRLLGQALERAYARKTLLDNAGASTEDVIHEILRASLQNPGRPFSARRRHFSGGEACTGSRQGSEQEGG
jgi:hypothetical protein